MLCYNNHRHHRALHSFPTRRSSDLELTAETIGKGERRRVVAWSAKALAPQEDDPAAVVVVGHDVTELQSAQRLRRRSEEHTSELQSLRHLVCRLLLEKKKKQSTYPS